MATWPGDSDMDGIGIGIYQSQLGTWSKSAISSLQELEAHLDACIVEGIEISDLGLDGGEGTHKFVSVQCSGLRCTKGGSWCETALRAWGIRWLWEWCDWR